MREGDKLSVVVEDIDAQGKISLKPIGEEWAIPEGQADESGGDRRPREGGGDRGGRGRWRRRPRPRWPAAVGGGDATRDRRGSRFRDDRRASVPRRHGVSPAPDAD